MIEVLEGKYTAQELARCAEREAGMRRSVYMKRAPGGVYTVEQTREIEMMEQMAQHFRRLNAEQTNDLFGAGSSVSS